MCYRMAAPPRTQEFVCRHCGGRTEYPFRAALPDVLSLESLLPSLPGWTFSLDDREFCRACTPGLRLRKPTIVLVARREGAQKERRTRGITPRDLEALGTTVEPTDWVVRLRLRYRRWRMLGSQSRAQG